MSTGIDGGNGDKHVIDLRVSPFYRWNVILSKNIIAIGTIKKIISIIKEAPDYQDVIQYASHLDPNVSCIREIRGISDAIGVDYNDLVIYNVFLLRNIRVDYFNMPGKECSVILVMSGLPTIINLLRSLLIKVLVFDNFRSLYSSYVFLGCTLFTNFIYNKHVCLIKILDKGNTSTRNSLIHPIMRTQIDLSTSKFMDKCISSYMRYAYIPTEIVFFTKNNFKAIKDHHHLKFTSSQLSTFTRHIPSNMKRESVMKFVSDNTVGDDYFVINIVL